MKLSEVKGDEALDLLAEVLEPVITIAQDKAVMALIQEAPAKAAKKLLKEHKPEVFQVLAALDGKSVEEYKTGVNIFTLPAQILGILNDQELLSLFTLQAQMVGEMSSGAASEVTTDQNK